MKTHTLNKTAHACIWGPSLPLMSGQALGISSECRCELFYSAMSFKHTPGPWVENPRDGTISTQDGTPIAQVFDNPDSGLDDMGEEQSDYNARLITAAPEMLDVLQRFAMAYWQAGVEAVKDSNDPIESLAYRTLEAIKKATTI